ncbi:hypothetical protein [Leifsonia shinshuensis]|uniref:hypothetical protein n=1 Tax=Leifsonia TaxID=110932 RepID=UPI0028560EDB|nr:hypothetical protein [Leifsonia shinshuensis]MDR6972578.1 hypothetical protein [Leifsonia shinshuensis]
MDAGISDESQRRRDDGSTMDERLTGVRDPRDPDGLLTVEEDAHRPDPTRYGAPETDTLERERAYFARLGEDGTAADLPEVPPPHGVTGLG